MDSRYSLLNVFTGFRRESQFYVAMENISFIFGVVDGGWWCWIIKIIICIAPKIPQWVAIYLARLEGKLFEENIVEVSPLKYFSIWLLCSKDTNVKYGLKTQKGVAKNSVKKSPFSVWVGVECFNEWRKWLKAQVGEKFEWLFWGFYRKQFKERVVLVF